MIEEHNTYKRTYDCTFIVKLRKDVMGNYYETYLDVEDGVIFIMEKVTGGEIIKTTTLGTIEKVLKGNS